jgi:thiol-disulfide isomerase/thioredoxin
MEACGMVHRRFTLYALVALVLVACGTVPAQPSSLALPPNVIASSKLSGSPSRAGVVVGEPAPDFQYTLPDGRVAHLSDLPGKVVILNFWATWCGPCRQEMPDLQKISDESNGAVVILGVNKLEETAAIVPFVKEVAVSFTLIANPEGDIPERYGVRNLPTSYFIRPDGTIGDWRLGAMDTKMIRASIAKSQ